MNPSLRAPSPLLEDVRLILLCATVFIGIVMAFGLLLAFTATPEATPLFFPLEGTDGSVALTRLFCDLPK